MACRPAEKHVENCEFAVVECSNEGCQEKINSQDRVRHENEVCKYGKVECRNCEHIQEVVERLENTLLELVCKVETTNEEVNNLEVLNGKVETLNKETEIRLDEMEQDLNKVEVIKKEIKDMKENISKVSQDVSEVKVMMAQMLEKLNCLEQLKKVKKLPSPTEGMSEVPKEDILVAGGDFKSVEIYSWEKNGWFKVSSMNGYHSGASSFIYNDELFVLGGDDDKRIEMLDLNRLPLEWRFSRELPCWCADHQTVVYQERVIHIGGRSLGEWNVVISELEITSRVPLKKLCRMPEPRDCHAAEIFEDKVLILGGENEDAMSSVLEFDVKKNECKEKPPLPRALSRMATVRWRDQVVVLGGWDKEQKVLGDVFMYDSKTGETIALPSMLEKRFECCAVITGNTIIVMGGRNEEGEDLTSVECFTMGSSTWKYLPEMEDFRYRAVSEVLPFGKEYV